MKRAITGIVAASVLLPGGCASVGDFGRAKENPAKAAKAASDMAQAADNDMFDASA
jgi:hypothetical protein